MPRRLKLLCPSIDDPSKPVGKTFTSEPCEGRTCFWWVPRVGCSANLQIRDSYAKHLDKVPLPDCPKATSGACRWHSEAMKRGEPACPVRRLGSVCEHAGGDWATWDMASPEEWPSPEELQS